MPTKSRNIKNSRDAFLSTFTRHRDTPIGVVLYIGEWFLAIRYMKWSRVPGFDKVH